MSVESFRHILDEKVAEEYEQVSEQIQVQNLLKNLLDFLLFNIKVTRMNDMFLKIDLVLLRKKSESILEKWLGDFQSY